MNKYFSTRCKPRSEIISQFQSAFPKLYSLSISHCPIKEWFTLEFLGLLESIKELSIDNLPVITTTQFHQSFKPDEIHKRKRYLIIAHLPTVNICNKSEISTDEREDAERFAIRYFSQVYCEDTWKCPSLYRKLTEKHGQLEQIAEVDMRPDRKVDIFIELIEDGSVFHKFEYSMDLKMTFEKIQGKIIGIWWDVQGENKNIDVNKLRWFIAKHFCTEHNSEIKRSRSKQIREKKMFKIDNWENGDILRCCY